MGVRQGQRKSAPLDSGLQGPPPGWGRPQGGGQLLNWRPAHGVLEDGGSDGFSPREKERAEHQSVAWPRFSSWLGGRSAAYMTFLKAEP
jgi:hypothetical protein